MSRRHGGPMLPVCGGTVRAGREPCSPFGVRSSMGSSTPRLNRMTRARFLSTICLLLIAAGNQAQGRPEIIARPPPWTGDPPRGWWLSSCESEFQRAADEVAANNPTVLDFLVAPSGPDYDREAGGEGVYVTLMGPEGYMEFEASVRVEWHKAARESAWPPLPALPKNGTVALLRSHAGRLAKVEAYRMIDRPLWAPLVRRFTQVADRCLEMKADLESHPALTLPSPPWGPPATDGGIGPQPWDLVCRNLIGDKENNVFYGEGQDVNAGIDDRFRQNGRIFSAHGREDYHRADTGWQVRSATSGNRPMLTESRAANFRHVSLKVISGDKAVADFYIRIIRPVLDQCLVLPNVYPPG